MHGSLDPKKVARRNKALQQEMAAVSFELLLAEAEAEQADAQA